LVYVKYKKHAALHELVLLVMSYAEETVEIHLVN